ncbi:MAG: hypothetical protein DSY42_01400 [Aquifex sp.]|nr:MAG: hypothetical protein DSY42_01400 [Aquifex sp.]
MIFSDIVGSTTRNVSFEDIENFLGKSLDTFMRNFGKSNHLVLEQYKLFEEKLVYLTENFAPIQEGKISFKFVGDGVIYSYS